MPLPWSASDLPQECGTHAHGRSACSLLDLECDHSASRSVSQLRRTADICGPALKQKSSMPVQKLQSMVPVGVSRTASSGAVCIAGTADTAALRAKASDKIVIFMLFDVRMLVVEFFSIREYPSDQEVEWRLVIAGAGNERGFRLTVSERECGEGDVSARRCWKVKFESVLVGL